jgi:hypothetical protein
MNEKQLEKAREYLHELQESEHIHIREMQEKQAQFNQQQWDFIAQCESEDDGNGP